MFVADLFLRFPLFLVNGVQVRQRRGRLCPTGAQEHGRVDRTNKGTYVEFYGIFLPVFKFGSKLALHFMVKFILFYT